MFKFLFRKRTETPNPPKTAGHQGTHPSGLAVMSDAAQWLQRLEWTVLKRLDGQLQGDYRSLFRGTGLVLADLREYQAHDDVRHIDWNVTARMQTPYVREHQEDREVAAWFVVDLSGSASFGSGGTSKRERACEAVALLGQMLTRHGNRVGALVFNGQPQAQCVLPARSGRRHLLHLVHTLLKTTPSTDASTSAQSSALSLWLAQTLSVVRRRSVVFVVSDFISEPGWEKPLAMLARRHDVVALRLQDPLELELPNVGMLWLQDAETGEQLLVDANDAGFRKRFADLAQKREAALRMGLAQAGVDGLVLRTDEALDLSLLRFAQLRKRVSQMGAGVSAGVSSAAMAPAGEVDWAARNPGGLHA
jgi:uncharacterized protein (DUF58 family)